MAHLTNVSFEFFYKIFTEDASLSLLYHGAKRVKNDQKLKSRGSCLKLVLLLINHTCTLYRRLPGCVVMGINRTRRLFGRQKKDAWAASHGNTLCMVFDQDALIFFLLSVCFFSSWSKKLHFRYAYTYFLDIYGMEQSSKEHSRLEY